MFGVLVNTLGAALGALIGLIAKKGIPDRVNDHLFKGIALFVMYVGIAGALDSKNAICMIISISLGALIGELLDLDKLLYKCVSAIENRFTKKKDDQGDGPQVDGEGKVSFTDAFVTTAILQCVGAYTVVGGLQAGLQGDYSLLFSKTGLDMTSSIILAASMGIGVLFASGAIFVVTGIIVILAQYLAPVLPDPVITEMMAVGSLVIMGQALNMLKLTDLKIMNFVPEIFMPIAVLPLYDYVTALV